MKLRKILCGSLMAVLGLSIFSFTSVIAETNGVIEVGKGEEKLYGVFNKVTNATDYNAYVKLSSASNYTKLDDQLVREVNGNIRVDAVGLKAGNYNLKFVPVINSAEDTTKQIELTDIVVGSYDRSGYAHFNYSDGVGAYNDDGTLKTDADVIYVSNETKNTVTYKGNVGLVSILQNQSSNSNPLNIRILDSIKTNQFVEKSDSPRVVDETYSDSYFTNELETTYGDNLVGLTIRLSDRKDGISYKYATTNNAFSLISTGSSTPDTKTYKKDEYPDAKGKTVYDDDSYFNMLDISLAKNVTIEGIGDSAEIFQWGFTWGKCDSIEVRNLKFTDYPEDACSFEGDKDANNKTGIEKYSNFWIHNNTFNRGKNNWDMTGERDKYAGDGAMDLKFLTNVTAGYNRFNNCKKTGLVGGGDSNYTKNITFHHNYYNQVESRLPLGRQANMHIYNNYYSNCGTCQDVRAKAYVLSESNYFDNCNTPHKTQSNAVIKSCNDIGGTATSVFRTATVSNSCKPDGVTDYSSFDMDSDLFYYDSSKQKSNVTVMNNASELPTLIPTVAGAGIFSAASYTVVGGDETENLKEVEYDNTSTATILNETAFTSSITTLTSTDSVPSTAGIYQQTNKANILPSDDIKVYSSSNGLEIYDNDENATLNGYYIFDATFNSGVVKYTINATFPTLHGNWTIMSFIGKNNNTFDIRSNENTKVLGYSMNGVVANTVEVCTDKYETNTQYSFILTINYDENKSSIQIGDDVKNDIPFSDEIKGIKFITASKARSFTVNSISIEKEETLKLGYQLGTYTQNDTSYKALRIIGKFNYDDVVIDSSNIDSIVINVELYNSSDVKYNTISATIDNLYTELAVTSNSETVVVAPEVDGQRYYYTVIKGIKSKHTGYHIKATTTITLKNGVVINCTGFDYKLA